MELTTVRIDKPETINFILGQTHFIKSVEDIHEALVTAVPGIKFGLAFCEASGKCLVRWSGTDPAMIELAQKNALALGAGHSFVVFLGEGFYPINVLNAVKLVPEVCRVFCATANPTEVILAETEQGRAILGDCRGVRAGGPGAGHTHSARRSAHRGCRRLRPLRRLDWGDPSRLGGGNHQPPRHVRAHSRERRGADRGPSLPAPLTSCGNCCTLGPCPYYCERPTPMPAGRSLTLTAVLGVKVSQEEHAFRCLVRFRRGTARVGLF